MSPSLKFRFNVTAKVGPPVLVACDEKTGRRQLIPVLSGELAGEGMHGIVLPGGVDSQIVRPDGRCELSARYGIRMDDGSGLYIQNDGLRTVPPEYAEAVFRGEFIDPSLYYFCTTPKFEIFSDALKWLQERVFICAARRLPDAVEINYYSVEI